MGAASPVIDYANASTALRFALRQALKSINTCLPGLVVSYDAATRRAKVQAALQMVGADGNPVDRPAVANVPVVFPSGGGFSLVFPLEAGDPVLLVYSQRGLRDFKKTHAMSQPGVESFFSYRDAIAIPGFGALSTIPAVPGAVSLQADDGSTYVSLGPDGVAIKTSGTVSIEAAEVTVNGSAL